MADLLDFNQFAITIPIINLIVMVIEVTALDPPGKSTPVTGSVLRAGWVDDVGAGLLAVQHGLLTGTDECGRGPMIARTVAVRAVLAALVGLLLRLGAPLIVSHQVLPVRHRVLPPVDQP